LSIDTHHVVERVCIHNIQTMLLYRRVFKIRASNCLNFEIQNITYLCTPLRRLRFVHVHIVHKLFRLQTDKREENIVNLCNFIYNHLVTILLILNTFNRISIIVSWYKNTKLPAGRKLCLTSRRHNVCHFATNENTNHTSTSYYTSSNHILHTIELCLHFRVYVAQLEQLLLNHWMMQKSTSLREQPTCEVHTYTLHYIVTATLLFGVTYKLM
jgi:hypothetical protein